MRIAIVHPWFLAMGGAEQVVSVLADIFPDADIFTLLYEKSSLPANLKNRNIIASKLNVLRAKYKVYRYLLPFYPIAFESLNLKGYDLVISSDSCLAKGVIIDQSATHICYCHSPMRCLYDQFHDYIAEFPLLIRPIFTLATHYLRVWDFVAAQRVTHFLANSINIAERIKAFYRLDSRVIYPPVSVSGGYIDDQQGDYFLTVGRMTSAKRTDLLIEACNRLGKRLIIAGSGREASKLKKTAGSTIEFVGRVSDEELRILYARCRAFLFAADEDFGIVPVEAQSFGRPVIAYGRGGTLETVLESQTGVYFEQQTVESVMDAILRFEAQENLFTPELIRHHALSFDTEVFKQQFLAVVKEALVGKKPQSGFAK